MGLGVAGYDRQAGACACASEWLIRGCMRCLCVFDCVRQGSAPKGAPIPVLGLQCTVGPVDPHASEHSHTMVLSTIRKETVVGAGSAEELEAWVEAISRAKSHSIKQQLGHVPQSDSDDFANRSGAFLTQRRMDRETEEVERGVGGPTAVVF